jgi:hypothetical protein
MLDELSFLSPRIQTEQDRRFSLRNPLQDYILSTHRLESSPIADAVVSGSRNQLADQKNTEKFH